MNSTNTVLRESVIGLITSDELYTHRQRGTKTDGHSSHRSQQTAETTLTSQSAHYYYWIGGVVVTALDLYREIASSLPGQCIAGYPRSTQPPVPLR